MVHGCEVYIDADTKGDPVVFAATPEFPEDAAELAFLDVEVIWPLKLDRRGSDRLERVFYGPSGNERKSWSGVGGEMGAKQQRKCKLGTIGTETLAALDLTFDT